MTESNGKTIPAINAVEGFNPAEYVRVTEENGNRDAYLDAKYRILWFRLHHPNGKLDPEIIHLDEKSACICCRVYADKSDPPEQFIGKAYSHRFYTQELFGERFLEVAETVAKGRALADAGYGTQFCFSGDTDTREIADSPIRLPQEDADELPVAPTSAAPVKPAPQAEVLTEPAPPPVMMAAERPEPTRPLTLDELIDTMSIEEAKAVRVDVGRYAGCTLGELALTHPGDLGWYVKNYAGRNLALKAGATVLLKAVEKIAS